MNNELVIKNIVNKLQKLLQHNNFTVKHRLLNMDKIKLSQIEIIFYSNKI